MPELNQLDFNPFLTLFLSIIHALSRPVVQIQMAGILVSLIFAWLGSRLIWTTLKKYNNKSIYPSTLTAIKSNIIIFSRLLFTPILTLIFLRLISHFYQFLNWNEGLLRIAIKIFFCLMIYRSLLGICYLLFKTKTVLFYQERLFNPLFVCFVIGIVLSLFANVTVLLQTPLMILLAIPLTLGKILLISIGVYFWIMLSILIEQLISFYMLSRQLVNAEMWKAISIILRYFLISIGLFLILVYIGLNITALSVISGGLSVGIGFGLKEVISNFVSGIWLLLEGSLKPGDIVDIGGEVCQVKSLGFRAATVHVLRNNSEKIIPNQLFFIQEVNTYTGSDSLVYRSLMVGATYQCDPQTVLKVLLDVAHAHPQVLKEPPPQTFFLGFGESSLDFELKFCIGNPLFGKRVTSELGCAVWKTFAEYNIEIPYPQRDLHLRSDETQFLNNERSNLELQDN
jgi:small-conductance mechanosensitive channel